MIANIQSTLDRSFDVCVVGAGPTGLALAIELEKLGHNVLLLDSGEEHPPSSRSNEPSSAIVANDFHAPMHLASQKALGGTSWSWGGRCVPLDPIDFADRGFVPHSRWPIGFDELSRWHDKAARFCGVEYAGFHLTPIHLKSQEHTVGLSSLERWSVEPRYCMVYKDRLKASDKITVCLKCTVIGLTFESGDVTSLVVSTDKGLMHVRSLHYVLCGGGVEITRLLLSIQSRHPRLFGGIDGPLGRFYMGHLSGKISRISFADPNTVEEFGYQRDGACYVRRRITLSERAQLEHRLLNCSFWPDNPPFYNPDHGSAVLSCVFLALLFEPIGRHLVSQPIRLAHVGSRPRRLAQHFKNIILRLPSGFVDLQRVVRGRFLQKPKTPSFLISSRDATYPLHYHAEQVPNPESRISVTGRTVSSGLAEIKIDFRFTEADVDSVLASHAVLDSALQEQGIGRLVYECGSSKLRDLIWKQASDGFHQVGTTRMGTCPQDSVVNSELKVHDFCNLHVASSSVFPTTGQANSTFAAVALAIRLAHRLSTQLSSTPDYRAISHT